MCTCVCRNGVCIHPWGIGRYPEQGCDEITEQEHCGHHFCSRPFLSTHKMWTTTVIEADSGEILERNLKDVHSMTSHKLLKPTQQRQRSAFTLSEWLAIH
ncbi:hypothetical protein TREES_T100015553 [Tupaia chinensis]|uniref:Uncharacterized protein n=1 Tax=Tupaia chinensis TaxID=246437 RepID=L9LBT2_TUPCH|nr:hypothetical protein TREES_T100015553 [Tupaia chinensis]